jgi:hypothetical protein
MMKILFLFNTVAAFQDVEAGQVMELPDVEAKYLIAIGKATAELPAPKPAARKAKAEAANGAD